MSFGWSAGDIISALQLISRISSSLKSASGPRAHFQELESELQSLERALTEISELTGSPEQIPEIHALKFASCVCVGTLERFYEKLKPFESSLGSTSTKGKLKAAPRMVRWELLVKKDIPELRTYLVAHVGSLNLRLTTAFLNVVTNSRKISKVDHNTLVQNFREQYEQLNAHILTIRDEVANIHKKDTIPTLQSLLLMTTNVWQSNIQLMDMLLTMKEQQPMPDLRFTWAQIPVALEDALGRRIIIPSEYDWDKVEAVIQAQFRNGPGSAKVKSGEYELFDSTDPENVLTPGHGLLPGMRLTMAIVVGQYSGSFRCPRPNCTQILSKHSKLSMKCWSCGKRFRITEKEMFRPVRSENGVATSKPIFTSRNASPCSRSDRRDYKNVSICFMELSVTYPESWQKQKRNRPGFQSESERQRKEYQGWSAPHSVASYPSVTSHAYSAPGTVIISTPHDNQGHRMSLSSTTLFATAIEGSSRTDSMPGPTTTRLERIVENVDTDTSSTYTFTDHALSQKLVLDGVDRSVVPRTSLPSSSSVPRSGISVRLRRNAILDFEADSNTETETNTKSTQSSGLRYDRPTLEQQEQGLEEVVSDTANQPSVPRTNLLNFTNNPKSRVVGSSLRFSDNATPELEADSDTERETNTKSPQISGPPALEQQTQAALVYRGMPTSLTPEDRLPYSRFHPEGFITQSYKAGLTPGCLAVDAKYFSQVPGVLECQHLHRIDPDAERALYGTEDERLLFTYLKIRRKMERVKGSLENMQWKRATLESIRDRNSSEDALTGDHVQWLKDYDSRRRELEAQVSVLKEEIQTLEKLCFGNKLGQNGQRKIDLDE